MFKIKIIFAVVLFTVFAACQSEPKVVDEAVVQGKTKKYVLANLAKLSEPERLASMVLKSMGVQEHEQPRFLEIYKVFLTYRDQMPQDLHRAAPAMELTFDLSQDDAGGSLLKATNPKVPTVEDPVYMAYELHVGPGVESALVADAGYVQQLAGLFQVSPRAIQRGLWIALQQDKDTLANAMVGYLESELKKGAATEDKLVDRILLPYLTYVSKGFSLSTENETAIAEAFGKVFGDAKVFSKALEELRYHINGEEPGVKKLHGLNEILLKKNLFLYLQPNQISIYQPHAYRVEFTKRSLKGLRALRSRGLAYRRQMLGCWPYATNEIYIPIENVAARRDIYRALVEKQTMPVVFSEGVNRVWREQGLGLNKDKVAAIYKDLATKAFADADPTKLLADLFHDEMILQIRCQADLKANAKMEGIDRAIGSYAVQITQGRLPELHLLTFIQHVQEQRVQSTLVEYNNRLDSLLVSLWKLAMEVQSGSLDRGGLQKRIRELHDNHQMKKAKGKLPGLESFEQDWVKVYLEPAPPLSAE